MNGHQSSVERWTGVRLWVYRGTTATMACALLLRSSQGGRYQDRLLARGVAPAPPGGVASTDACAAALAGVMALRGEGWVRLTLDQLLREARSGPPGGLQGDTPPGLDTAATLKNEAAAAVAKSPERSEGQLELWS